MRKICVSLLFFLMVLICRAQEPGSTRLKVFIDCNTNGCDMQYIRSEITVVDFLLDNQASDLHVLITSQQTGSGGFQFQLIFFGQHRYAQQSDTLRFITDPNATEFEQRDMLLKYLKAGLVPFLVKAGLSGSIDIRMKGGEAIATDSITPAADPWNNWVMRISADGNLNADANYSTKYFSGSANANRITDKLKIGFGVYASRNKSVFEYEENGLQQQFVVNNHNTWINQYLVKSIDRHWSWAYEVRYSQNTFSNIKGRAFARAAVEYNLFPYDQVNTRLLTFSYGFTARQNRYYDSTIYNKLSESLLGHRATASLSLNQKWGNSWAGIYYNNYFSNWKFFNLGIDIYSSVRITGGLSFYVLCFGGLTRDQVFLVKGGATPEEVLARRRQLASGYNYYFNIGLTYRFGSKLNNVVNPRFDRSGSGVDD